MQLEERVHFFPTRDSGGERQRAAIARALANDSKIILADELTGSVDTETGAAILDYLTAYCRKRDVSMIIATHTMKSPFAPTVSCG
jgi:putative ABC transport system ATP-binding protein